MDLSILKMRTQFAFLTAGVPSKSKTYTRSELKAAILEEIGASLAVMFYVEWERFKSV